MNKLVWNRVELSTQQKGPNVLGPESSAASVSSATQTPHAPTGPSAPWRKRGPGSRLLMLRRDGKKVLLPLGKWALGSRPALALSPHRPELLSCWGPPQAPFSFLSWAFIVELARSLSPRCHHHRSFLREGTKNAACPNGAVGWAGPGPVVPKPNKTRTEHLVCTWFRRVRSEREAKGMLHLFSGPPGFLAFGFLALRGCLPAQENGLCWTWALHSHWVLQWRQSLEPLLHQVASSQETVGTFL